MLYDFFCHGINLGGWLSQYECVDPAPSTKEERSEHFKTFITEENIRQIASWGLDHIRLPIDSCVLESDENPYVLRVEAFFYLDQCADWCEKYGLNMIIDLHHAQGNVWGMMDAPMPLLIEEVYQRRFINIWEQMARHFQKRDSPCIMFELLNEVSDGSGYLWDALCERTVAAIRKIDRSRFIMIGSNGQNSVFLLKELALLEDQNVFYNFHFYDPQVFTHQKAHFSQEMKEFNQTVAYPGDISSFVPFLLKNRQYLPKYSRVATEITNDRALMGKLLKDAIDFVTYSGRELYCGEFGAISNAPVDSAARWLKDCIRIFDRNHIGHAIWNYKELDFGFVDKENEIVSIDLVRQLFLTDSSGRS